MATNLLSAAECKNATSNGAGIRKLHDGDGLYLWIYLDGRKYWRMRYWQTGKEKSLSAGVYPKISLSDARKKRDELRQQLQSDLDPSAERKATNLRKKLANENSFEAVAMEWFNKQVHTWVKHHADDVKRRLESNIFPTLGKRLIEQINAMELLDTIQKIESRGAYDLAHRVLQVCGQVFRYGIATGRCTRNHSADLRGALTPHVKKHQSAVRPEELPDLLIASTALTDHNMNDTAPPNSCRHACGVFYLHQANTAQNLSSAYRIASLASALPMALVAK